MTTTTLLAERDVLDVIYHRRAVRSYNTDLVEDQQILALLEAAVHAPTAMHQEPWHFVVVQDRSLLKRLSNTAKTMAREEALRHGNVLKPHGGRGDGIASQMADPEFNIFYDAGTLVLICARPVNDFVTADCWLAAENLMLAACADGLGTCPIGYAVPALNSWECKDELGIPADLHVFAPIIVGVPRGVQPLIPRKPAVVLNWIR